MIPRRLTAALLVALVGSLTACGGKSTSPSSSPSPISSTQFAPPADCRNTKVFATIKSAIPGSTWIDTNWTPAAGTDLEAIYRAGGIACTYGIASAEVGGTFSWARDASGLFQSRTAQWRADGQVKSDIPGLSVDALYEISDAARSKMEIPSYLANVLVHGIWIQIGGRFINSEVDAKRYIQSAIDSIATSTQHITGCYIGKLAKDIYYLDVVKQNDNRVVANIFYNTFEKDDSSGTFDGVYTNGILNGMYTFQSEGSTSRRELFFKGDINGFTAGYGAPDPVNGEKFARPLSISWDKQFAFLPATGCVTKS